MAKQASDAQGLAAEKLKALQTTLEKLDKAYGKGYYVIRKYNTNNILHDSIEGLSEAYRVADDNGYEVIYAEGYDKDEYKRGGKVDGRSTRAKNTWNSGASWTRDRNAYNKSENWEKPMNKRKYAEGGEVRMFEILDEVEDYSEVNKNDIPKILAQESFEKGLDDDEIQTKINKHLIKLGYNYDSNEYTWKKSYAEGGVPRNVGRDWLFKSKQKWEQDYDRKREYKEYKKEGWLANWFKEGGEAKEYGADEIGTYDFVYIKSLGGKEGMVMEISGENCRVRTDENRLAEKDTWFNKSDLKVARGNNERLFAKGGRVKNYKYVPNYMIESVDVERNGKTTEIDGGNILDGLYVKGKVAFEEGGYVENIPTETLESMIGRKLNGWNDDVVIYNGVAYKKCFMKPYYKIA